MLNDILAGCVAAAVVVVFATIFGAVELMWKVLHLISSLLKKEKHQRRPVSRVLSPERLP